MLIGAVSDTHNFPYRLPQRVDILIHAGDLTIEGSHGEIRAAVKQLLEQPADERVVVAGNHDYALEHSDEIRSYLKDMGIIYLQDEEATVNGLRFYGSPYTLEWGTYSFQLKRDQEIGDAHWAKIPEGIDILVTHSPPWGRFDVPYGGYNHVGCPALMRALPRVKPRVHVFGHIHSPGDVIAEDGIRYINAAQTSTLGGRYSLAYEPITFELEPKC